MSFKLVNDRGGGRYSRKQEDFAGTHFGFSPVDQPAQYAFVTDFDCQQDKLTLRPGMRKDETYGYYGDIDGLGQVNVTPDSMVFVISNGSLSLYMQGDIVNGTPKFYTWDEVSKKFTWDTLKDKTWRDLVTGR